MVLAAVMLMPFVTALTLTPAPPETDTTALSATRESLLAAPNSMLSFELTATALLASTVTLAAATETVRTALIMMSLPVAAVESDKPDCAATLTAPVVLVRLTSAIPLRDTGPADDVIPTALAPAIVTPD